MSRGGVQARQRRLRRLAAHEVAVVRRARGARSLIVACTAARTCSCPTRWPRCSTPSAAARSAHARGSGLASPARPPGVRRPVEPRGPPRRARPQTEGAEAPALAARACGAIVARRSDGRCGTCHSSELARWDQVHADIRADTRDAPGALSQAFGSRGRARVELKRWFSWRWYWDDALVEELVDAGKLRRVDAHVTPGL